mmetsp:Transcript_12468/g.37474  ORF Transcript_12468/g.37474 Transcript_12468/m.37474 type:complete len:225 (+) Transcript_12468:3577-4251(+)
MWSNIRQRLVTLLGGCITLRNLLPVDELAHEGLDVLRPPVLHVQVVSVLPDIHHQDGLLARGDGVLGVGGLHHRQLAVVHHQPCPPGAELGGASGGELLQEIIHGAEGGLDVRLQVTAHLLLGGGHGLPVELVVPGLSRVVEFGGGRPVVPGRQHHLLQRLALQGGVVLDLAIQVGDVRLVVLAVVDVQGVLGNLRLQGSLLIWQRWEGESRPGDDTTTACLRL